MARFGKRPEEQEVPMQATSGNRPKSGSSSQVGQVNMIGDGATIEGTVQVKGDIRIGGVVKGEIEVDGKLITTKEGKIDGDARTQQADIAGKVTGSIIAKERLILRSTSVVEGDVQTPKMVIEDGAIFTGKADMSPGGGKKTSTHVPDLASKPGPTSARPVEGQGQPHKGSSI